MKYGSVCSGIEAASVAWEPLGWTSAWFAEIEPFPAAVLAHHWPHIENLGDMTTIRDRIKAGEIEAPDVLVGGTPCQAFSVAGLRNSLDDDRGQLTLEFVRLANAIDSRRAAAGLDQSIIVWENVPGVLSTRDNAFGCFLGALAGEDCELQPSGKRWSNAGCVFGPKRTVAWRVLDAQYFGVPQRRRRVFVVASARKGFDPAAVLFEREGVRRDSAPSREAWSSVAAITASGVGTCGADDNQGQAGHLIPAAIPICHVVHGTQDPCHSATTAFALGRNNGQENAVCVAGDVTHALNTANNGKGSSEDGTGRGVPTVAYPLLEVGKRTGKSTDDPRAWLGVGKDTDPMYTLQAGAQHGVAADMAVRRLTPIECERLQGFPDNHTQIPWRNKPAAKCPDGPRYKAIGNSMAVPVMRWIGERLAQHVSDLERAA